VNVNKAVLLLLSLLYLLPLPAALQDYEFSYSEVSWQEITGGVALGTDANDDNLFLDPAYPGGITASTACGFPIPFDFVFDHQVYDRFGVNTNGWIGLGKSIYQDQAVDLSSSTDFNPLSYTNAAHPHEDRIARISGFARNLAAQSGASLRYEVIGSEPQRILVIQWKNYRRYGYVSGDIFTFQIRLHEQGSRISIVYHQMQCSGSNSGQVGLRSAPAAAATNFANRTTGAGWDNSASGSSAHDSASLTASSFPVSGACFTWQIAGIPIADFSAIPLSGFAPLQVQFYDTSTAADAPITAWHWEFGDGSVSGLQNPAHTYMLPGTYHVSLRVTDSNGNQHTRTRQQYITVYQADTSTTAYLQMNGFDAHLSWDPINTDEQGNPIQPSFYYLYFNGSSDPQGEYYFLAPIEYPATQFIHHGVGRGARHMFYKVKAVE
jgi:hypothetical protein